MGRHEQCGGAQASRLSYGLRIRTVEESGVALGLQQDWRRSGGQFQNLSMTNGVSEEPGHPVAGRVSSGTRCLPLLLPAPLFVLLGTSPHGTRNCGAGS